MLQGRDAERAALAKLLEAARGSRSGVLMVRGPAGIGKSALIADALDDTEGLLVLRATGVESESSLAFAGLHQLLRPVLELVRELPGPQAAALESALGIGPPGGEDPLRVGAGVLSVLAAAAERQPVLCVLEDVHWLDAPSTDALVFAARRLEAEAVALVFSTREDVSPLDLLGFPELQLHGLDSAASAALLDASSPGALHPLTRQRILETARGNPLVLVELPLALTAEQLAGREPLEEPLPLTRRLEDAFRSRASWLGDEEQALLLVAAADNTGEVDVVLEAARKLGAEREHVETVEVSGLLRLSGGVEFRHALVRSVVYHSASFAKRQEAHLALAETLTDERFADRRAWQLAAAATGPDDEVADELERSAERAIARSGRASAVVALARAAALTRDPEVRARRQLAAAEAASQVGQNELAVSLLAEARRTATDPLLLADADQLRGALELQEGSPSAACEILLAAATAAEPLDPGRAARILLDGTSAAIYACDRQAQDEFGRRAGALSERVGPMFELTVSEGLALLWSGEAERARCLLEGAIEQAETGDHPRRLTWAAVCSLHLGDETRGRRFATRDAELARAEGTLRSLVTTLSRLAFAELMEGRLASAAVHTTEGVSLAREAGLENSECYHHALLAWAAGLLGRETEAREEADAALRLARGHERTWQAAVVQVALGELELGLGDAERALTHLQALSPGGSHAAHQYLVARPVPALVIAAVRARRPEVAVEELARFEEWVDATHSCSQLPLLLRSRALLVDDADEARRLFEQALVLHAELPRSFERARTELLFGEALRRSGARREARDHLRISLDLFDRIGAATWAEQAAAELRATGETLRRRGQTRGSLTPQELQIARLVAAGATNKEVASQLFLSPRTVDAHLRNVFTKLRIASRTELRDLRLGDAEDELAALGVAVSPTRT